MQLVKGNLWDELGVADIILVTTNAFVKQNGELVMGRGAAREARDRFPGIAKKLGQYIGFYEPFPGNEFAKYGTILTPYGPDGTTIGAFQVKWSWNEQADLELIENSVMRTKAIAEWDSVRRLAMNFPGIGNGGLDRKQVLPIIEELPDNVFVYEKG